MSSNPQPTETTGQGGQCRIIWRGKHGAGEGAWWPDHMRYQLEDVAQVWNHIHGQGTYQVEVRQ